MITDRSLRLDDPVFLLNPNRQTLVETRAQLTVIRGGQIGQIFSLKADSCVFGRVGERQLQDVMVSRRHMQITQKEGQYVIEDLGSTNGTFVNGQRIARSVILQHGDFIRVGETMFSFELAGHEPVIRVQGAAPQRFADHSREEATITTRKFTGALKEPAVKGPDSYT
jgi:pSer/pThr/pTyr-binding forkhead associated (FHA) protein